MTATIIHGNNLDILPTFDDCSIDAIVTDPPYELGFMGKRWDASGIAYNITLWQECLRVLKPGGHLLAFGGTRTYHRMACAIEDSGFEIRDSIHWLYGSGFPKSLDVSKAIDKQRDDSLPSAVVAEFLIAQNTFSSISEFRQYLNKNIIGENHSGGSAQGWTTKNTNATVKPRVPTWDQWLELKSLLGFGDEMDAEVWRLNGRKGQPGEAWSEREIIGKGKQNMTEASVWATELGSGRFQVGEKEWDITAPATEQAKQWAGWGTALKPAHEPIVVARKPLIGTVAANVLEFGTGAINIDASRIAGAPWTPVAPNAGGRSGGVMGKHTEHPGGEPHLAGRWPANVILDDTIANSHDDWPRYFYCAKPSRKERNAGLNHLDEKPGGVKNDSGRGYSESDPHKEIRYQNHHPTVKPLALMRYLVRLVTPPGGTVLDPFAGSGTTLMAAILEGFNAIGIEMTDEYLPIIQGRVAWAENEVNQQSPDQQELDL